MLFYLKSGNDLSSRSVSRQVLSARVSLTSVFGMGTGGSLLPLSPEWLRLLDLKPLTDYKNSRFTPFLAKIRQNRLDSGSFQKLCSTYAQPKKIINLKRNRYF